MVTYLGSLLQLCCVNGGTLQTNIPGLCEACSQCMDHTRFAPAFPSTLLRLQVALQGYCSKWALDFMHFPDLSCSGSGSQILHKDTDSVECVFSALPRFKQLRRPVLASALHLNHLPNPGCSVSQMCCNSTISDVPCVSSGELISGCNPPGRCQPSRIPERLG